ncbi:MAG TPA: glutamine amidotransferase, partial [Bacillota bacterium]|nr:glutamine amidotransferase [Bacillota bacterium]
DLAGYLITKPKNLATVYLEVGKNDPLLVDWRYGNGRVAVFTSDSGSRWLNRWSENPLYNRLWSQVIRTIERRTADAGLRIQSKVEAASARVVVEAIDTEGHLRSGLQLQGRFVGSNTAFVLPETAPGRYEATVMLPGSGLQSFEVLDRINKNWASGWVWNPPGEELQVLGPDYALLSYLSATTGGMEFKTGNIRLPGSSWSWIPLDLTPWLIGFALLFFIIELGYRSTSLGQVAMARTMASAWWNVQKHLIGMVKSRQWENGSTPNSQSEATFNAYRYLAQNSQRLKGDRSLDPTPQEHPDNEQH